jgi:hypothetical protein
VNAPVTLIAFSPLSIIWLITGLFQRIQPDPWWLPAASPSPAGEGRGPQRSAAANFRLTSEQKFYKIGVIDQRTFPIESFSKHASLAQPSTLKKWELHQIQKILLFPTFSL